MTSRSRLEVESPLAERSRLAARSRLGALIELARIEQWLKNVAILPGAIVAALFRPELVTADILRVALVLAAASLAAERDENVLGRLTRGLVGRGELVGEKVAFVALVGATIGLLLAVAFGITVELGEAPGGQPWQRLPLVVVGLL